jgi:hypothetical protein
MMKMNTTQGGKRGFILAIVFIVILVSVWIYGIVDVRQTYSGIMDGQRIDSVSMYIESDSLLAKKSIHKDSVLENLNRACRQVQEWLPDTPKMHSVLIEMTVYKSRKLKLDLLKTKYSGWVMEIGGTYYRGDSLSAILDDFVRR